MLMRSMLAILIIILFFGIVWSIAEVYIFGFSLSSSGAHAVYLAAGIFAVLFLFSFFSSRFTSAYRFRLLYKLFNMFIAVVFYLLPLAVALALIFGIGSFSPTATREISIIALYLAAALGMVGIIQAREIRVVSKTIQLKNAPSSWNGRTAVLVSDTHFGLVRNVRFSKKIVQKIKSLSPNFVLHAGDFYDGPSVDMPPITAPWKELAQQLPIFYTPGNHEMYGPYRAFVDSVRDAGAATLLDAVTEYDGVQIAGITYRDRTKRKEAEAAINSLTLDPTKPTILINHPPTFQRAAEKKGVQLMVSGHTHGGQFWPNNYVVRMLYGKYTYGMHRVGEMTALTTRGVGTAGPPCRLFIPPEIILLTFKTQ